MNDSVPDTAAQPTTWSPFRSRIFRNVWLATLASNFGGLIQAVGASWMMVAMGSSATMIAMVQACNTLPILLFSLTAGALSDGVDRRLIMLWSQTVMLIVSFILTGLAFVGWLSPWSLLLLTFLIGSAAAFNGPAWQASIAEMVPKADLTGAVVLNSLSYNIARSAGPALGGAIVAVAGATFAFLVNAFTYFGLIAVLLRWRPGRPVRSMPSEPLGRAIITGIRYVAMSPDLRPLLLRSLLFGIASSAVPALLPLVARDHLFGGALTYGLSLGGLGLGAVIGALGSAYLNRRLSNEWILRLANAALAIGTVGVALSSFFPFVFVALMLAGMGWMTGLSMFNVTMQMALPRWVVARGLSLYRMCAFGGMAIGSWLFGAITQHRGLALALLIAGGLQVVAGGIGFWRSLPMLGSMNLDPLVRWAEPDTDISLDPSSGPIAVSIEYRIAADSVSAFLSAMKERRRIRRRDGARHWSLFCNINDRQLWVERYEVATWNDYVRHNQRRTYADAANSDTIRSFHIGSESPHVQRLIARDAGTVEGPASGAVLHPAQDATL